MNSIRRGFVPQLETVSKIRYNNNQDGIFQCVIMTLIKKFLFGDDFIQIAAYRLNVLLSTTTSIEEFMTILNANNTMTSLFQIVVDFVPLKTISYIYNENGILTIAKNIHVYYMICRTFKDLEVLIQDDIHYTHVISQSQSNIVLSSWFYNFST